MKTLEYYQDLETEILSVPQHTLKILNFDFKYLSNINLFK